MDLAFHFYPFTELGRFELLDRSNILDYSCSLNFLIVLPLFAARSLRCKTAAFFQLTTRSSASESFLNIRNIFRVAFLSCSHIRLEMCSGSLQGRWPVCCLRFVFLSGDNFYKISQCFGSVNNFFKELFKKFLQRRSPVISGNKKMKRTSSVDHVGSFHLFERRKRDLNPRAGSPDLLPFQGSPFGLLGISP